MDSASRQGKSKVALIYLCMYFPGDCSFFGDSSIAKLIAKVLLAQSRHLQLFPVFQHSVIMWDLIPNADAYVSLNYCYKQD